MSGRTLQCGYPRARKALACMTCGSPVSVGERYYRWTGVNDAWIGLATLKECAACCERYGRPIPVAAASDETEPA